MVLCFLPYIYLKAFLHLVFAWDIISSLFRSLFPCQSFLSYLFSFFLLYLLASSSLFLFFSLCVSTFLFWFIPFCFPFLVSYCAFFCPKVFISLLPVVLPPSFSPQLFFLCHLVIHLFAVSFYLSYVSPYFPFLLCSFIVPSCLTSFTPSFLVSFLLSKCPSFLLPYFVPFLPCFFASSPVSFFLCFFLPFSSLCLSFFPSFFPSYLPISSLFFLLSLFLPQFPSFFPFYSLFFLIYLLLSQVSFSLFSSVFLPSCITDITPHCVIFPPPMSFKCCRLGSLFRINLLM